MVYVNISEFLSKDEQSYSHIRTLKRSYNNRVHSRHEELLEKEIDLLNHILKTTDINPVIRNHLTDKMLPLLKQGQETLGHIACYLVNDVSFSEREKEMVRKFAIFLLEQLRKHHCFVRFNPRNSHPLEYSIIHDEPLLVGTIIRLNRVRLNIFFPRCKKNPFGLAVNLKRLKCLEVLMSSGFRPVVDVENLTKNQDVIQLVHSFLPKLWHIEDKDVFGKQIQYLDRFKYRYFFKGFLRYAMENQLTGHIKKLIRYKKITEHISHVTTTHADNIFHYIAKHMEFYHFDMVFPFCFPRLLFYRNSDSLTPIDCALQLPDTDNNLELKKRFLSISC